MSLEDNPPASKYIGLNSGPYSLRAGSPSNSAYLDHYNALVSLLFRVDGLVPSAENRDMVEALQDAVKSQITQAEKMKAKEWRRQRKVGLATKQMDMGKIYHGPTSQQLLTPHFQKC